MNLEHIRSFVVIASLLSYTKASKELHISQSTLSRHITLLEHDLGVKLFVRCNQPLQLTEAGKVLLLNGARFIEDADKLMEHVRRAAHIGEGTLYIRTLTTTFNQLYNSCRQFRRQYPSVHFVFDRRYYGDISIGSFLGCADIGILPSQILSEYKNDLDDYEQKCIWRDNFFLICNTEHKLAKTEVKNITMSQLDVSELLFFSSQDVTYFRMMAANLPKELPKHLMQNSPNSPEALLLLVDAGQGAAILPGKATEELGNRFYFVEITDSALSCDIYAIYHKDNNNPYIPIFLDCIGNLTD